MKYSNTYQNDLQLIEETVANIKDIYNSKIFISGANGMIGSAIIDFLMSLNKNEAANIKIYAGVRTKNKFDKRFSIYKKCNNLYYLNYNTDKVLNYKIKFDYIIHAASPSSPSNYKNKPVETMKANFCGLLHLFEYSRKNGIRRLLYISSSEVYGTGNDEEKKESDSYYIDILKYRSCYPSSKRAAETLCSAYYKEYNLDSVIVRPGHIYGPTMTEYDDRAASQFIRDVCNDKDIIMKSKGEQKRSYCYVLDCVSAIMTVLINGKSCEAYNIADKKSNISIYEFAEYVAKSAKKKIIIKAANKEEKEYNPMKNSVLDSKKLRNLKWHSLFNISKGIKHTLIELNEN